MPYSSNRELPSRVRDNLPEHAQAIFTQIVAQQLQGKWTGDGSAEALLYALDPNLTGTLALDPPITESEAESLPKG